MDSIDQQLAELGINLDRKSLEAICQLQSSGLISLGWPGKECLPNSLVWIPNQTDHNLRSTAIVSSRLGRQVDRLDPIFRVLRCAISQLDPNRQQVVSSEGTAMHRYVARACQLFGVPLLKVTAAKPSQSLARWLQVCLDHSQRLAECPEACPKEVKAGPTVEATAVTNQCFVSNPIGTAPGQPTRDQVEVLASDQLLVLHARAKGNLSCLLHERLDSAPQTGSMSRTYLALGHEGLVPQDLASELMSRGAVGWLPMGDESTLACPMDWTMSSKSPILDQLPNPGGHFIHCTRRAAGAWPDQQVSAFLDELILGQPAKDRSSLAALSRIVRMQTLLASHESIRDATAVVSFTAATIDQLVEMRTFRAHRGRWDFEPYGIAIEREWLVKQGAHEVIYGDEQKWKELSDSERPLYQKIGDQANAIDWTIEQEWRVIGDLDLSDLPKDKGAVFVPTRDEANQLARISPWPVVICS